MNLLRGLCLPSCFVQFSILNAIQKYAVTSLEIYVMEKLCVGGIGMKPKNMLIVIGA